jgi:hypothetical protein
LNKRGNLNLNLRGVGDATGVEVGLAATSVIAFLRTGLGFGDAAGDVAAEGDVALSAGDTASVSFCGDVLVVKGIRQASRSEAAIELAQRKL